jgi:hypothetical protein
MLVGITLAFSACARDPDPKESDSLVAAASVAGPCGVAGQPDCPLQGWMKATMTPAISAGDLVRLERDFKRIADFAPPDYGRWKAISGAGADAAAHGDIEGARQACKSCHDEFRARYRRELRARALP